MTNTLSINTNLHMLVPPKIKTAYFLFIGDLDLSDQQKNTLWDQVIRANFFAKDCEYDYDRIAKGLYNLWEKKLQEFILWDEDYTDDDCRHWRYFIPDWKYINDGLDWIWEKVRELEQKFLND